MLKWVVFRKKGKMKKVLFTFCLLFISDLWLSCTPSYWQELALKGGSSVDNENRRRRLVRGSSRIQNECEDFDRCKDICDRVLDYTSERIECYRWPLADIGAVQDVMEILQDPKRNDVEDIHSRDFDLFAEIALDSWARLIVGEYRRDEAGDDDDDDGDDAQNDYFEHFKYTKKEAQEVLDWMITNSYVAESIRDFTSSTDILYNLFQQIGESSDSTSLPSVIRIGIDRAGVLNNLRDSEKDVIKGLYEDLNLFGVVGTDASINVSALYEMTHEMLEDICKGVDITGQSDKNARKICLSLIYFCDDRVKRYQNLTSSFREEDRRGALRYLLNNSYRRVPESGAVNCDSGIKSFSNWSDYWN